MAVSLPIHAPQVAEEVVAALLEAAEDLYKSKAIPLQQSITVGAVPIG